MSSQVRPAKLKICSGFLVPRRQDPKPLQQERSYLHGLNFVLCTFPHVAHRYFSARLYRELEVAPHPVHLFPKMGLIADADCEDVVGDDFKAFVIPTGSYGTERRRPHAFASFAAALVFMKSTKGWTVLIEFSVETDTLDFYDAVKALGVPVIFSADRLNPSQFSQFGIRAAAVVYPGHETQTDNFADYRPRPGIKGSLSNINLMTSSAV